GADGTVRVWEVASGRERLRLVGHGRPVRAVTFSPDGRRLASAGEDGFARLWDGATGRGLRQFGGHGGGGPAPAVHRRRRVPGPRRPGRGRPGLGYGGRQAGPHAARARGGGVVPGVRPGGAAGGGVRRRGGAAVGRGGDGAAGAARAHRGGPRRR